MTFIDWLFFGSVFISGISMGVRLGRHMEKAAILWDEK
jgi:hypothetical protein